MKPIRIGLALLNLLLLCLLAAVGLGAFSETDDPEPVSAALEIVPVVPTGPVVRELVHTVQRGETVGAILQAHGVAQVHELVEAVRPHADLSRVRVGDELALTTVDGVATHLSYRFSTDDTLHVALGESIDVQVETAAYERGLERVSIPIVGSLWQSAIERGFSAAAVLEMSKVFENEVDFATDLRAGAAVTVVVDRLSLDGQRVRYEAIHAMELENRGERYTAVYFDGTEASSGWYAPDGTSLERPELAPPKGVVTGLGPPVAKASYMARQTRATQDRYGPDQIYVSNDFYQRRCNGRCRHSALDIRAAQGTPLVALASGRVNAITKPTTLCGSGVQVAMDGADGESYSALYCHMSSVEVKLGQTVKKGQRLGLSGGRPGSAGAGRSTAPHLHLELRRENAKGKYRLIDPAPMIDWRPFTATVRHTPGHEPKAPEPVALPPKNILKTDEADAFAAQRDGWMDGLHGSDDALSDAQPEAADAGQG